MNELLEQLLAASKVMRGKKCGALPAKLRRAIEIRQELRKIEVDVRYGDVLAKIETAIERRRGER